MATTELAIKIIDRYIDDNLPEPYIYWPEGMFAKRSYERWSAYEIIDRLMSKPFDDPIDVIDEFVHEMTMRSVVYDLLEDSQKSFIFDTAADTGEEILRLFL